MAVHTYECLYLLDPNKASADFEGIKNRLGAIITKYGGEIIESRPFGETKLTYPIRRFRKGTYLLTYFTADAERIVEMEGDYRLDEAILRHLIIRHHPKIAKQIIDHLNAPPAPAEVAASN